METIRIAKTHEAATWNDAAEIARDVQAADTLGRTYYAAATEYQMFVIGYRVTDDEFNDHDNEIDVYKHGATSARILMITHRNRPYTWDAKRVHNVAEAERMAYDEDHNRSEGLRILAAAQDAGRVHNPVEAERLAYIEGTLTERIDAAERVADSSGADDTHHEPIEHPHRDCIVGSETHKPHAFIIHDDGWSMVSCPGWTEDDGDDLTSMSLPDVGDRIRLYDGTEVRVTGLRFGDDVPDTWRVRADGDDFATWVTLDEIAGYVESDTGNVG